MKFYHIFSFRFPQKSSLTQFATLNLRNFLNPYVFVFNDCKTFWLEKKNHALPLFFHKIVWSKYSYKKS